MFHREVLRAFGNEVDVQALAQNLARGSYRVPEVLHATDAASAQGCAIHDERVKLNLAFAIEKAAAASVEGLIVFHDDDRFFDGIESRASAGQNAPARGDRVAHTTKMGVHHVIG